MSEQNGEPATGVWSDITYCKKCGKVITEKEAFDCQGYCHECLGIVEGLDQVDESLDQFVKST